MKRFFFSGSSSNNNNTAAAVTTTTASSSSLLSTPTRVPLRKKSDTTAALVAAATLSSTSTTPPGSPSRTSNNNNIHQSDNAISSPSRGRCGSNNSNHSSGGGSSGNLELLLSSPADTTGGGCGGGSSSNSNSGGCRVRLNSRDIPRTYSGLYGRGDDLLPFELSRHGTLTTVFKRKQYQGVLLGTYVTILVLVQVIVGMILNVSSAAAAASASVVPSSALLDVSWTCTNVLHTFISIVYIHWMKGSCLYPADDNGEMNGLTLWEQLDATPDTRWLREALMLVPCLLTWIACHATDYQWKWSLLNGLLWIASMLGKLPCMNGVRIFGINRTVGIDDDLLGMGDDDDDDDMKDDDLDVGVLQQPTSAEQQHQQPTRERTGSSSGNYALLGIDEKKSQ